jgi:hypothetical protein
MFISGVNGTGNKLFGGAKDTPDKFFKTVLPILACLHQKMKNKQKLNL